MDVLVCLNQQSWTNCLFVFVCCDSRDVTQTNTHTHTHFSLCKLRIEVLASAHGMRGRLTLSDCLRTPLVSQTVSNVRTHRPVKRAIPTHQTPPPNLPLPPSVLPSSPPSVPPSEHPCYQAPNLSHRVWVNLDPVSVASCAVRPITALIKHC